MDPTCMNTYFRWAPPCPNSSAIAFATQAPLTQDLRSNLQEGLQINGKGWE